MKFVIISDLVKRGLIYAKYLDIKIHHTHTKISIYSSLIKFYNNI